MRILLLTILFIGPYLYLRQGPENESSETDVIQTKQGAPERIGAERTLTLKSSETPKSEMDLLESEGQDSSIEAPTTEEDPEVETADEVQLPDLEEGWNNELKSMLNRLEPEDGDTLFKNYREELDSYQNQMDSLLNEKGQSGSKEGASDVDQLISQLDESHQKRLKEILGAHYDAVRDQYYQYLESSQGD